MFFFPYFSGFVLLSGPEGAHETNFSQELLRLFSHLLFYYRKEKVVGIAGREEGGNNLCCSRTCLQKTE